MTKATIFLSMRLFVNAVIGSTKHLLWHAAVANQSKLANHHLELSANETDRDVIQSVSLHWAIFSFRFNEEVTIALFSPRLFVPEICPRNTGRNLISTFVLLFLIKIAINAFTAIFLGGYVFRSMFSSLWETVAYWSVDGGIGELLVGLLRRPIWTRLGAG